MGRVRRISASIGAALGVGIAYLLLVLGDLCPSGQFTLAVIVLSLAVSLTAAGVPAIIAARRHPIEELRVA